MYEFQYHRPLSLADAQRLFAASGEARYISGGQSLLPTMKQRLAAPSDLIDIAGLMELRGIAVTPESVSIGAAMTHAQVATSADVAKAIPPLAELAALIGDPAVRHLGTIGGSVANNDPAADYPAAALALDAVIHTDRRKVPAAEFFTGLFATVLEEGEIVTRVAFQRPVKAAWMKFRNPASRYAMAGVFVAVMRGGPVRVGVTGAGNTGPFRWAEGEAALAHGWAPATAHEADLDPDTLLSDIHGSAAYRANLVKVMTARAVAAAG
jgi:carbon-monoxide dehydrogenase medium subunit